KSSWRVIIKATNCARSCFAIKPSAKSNRPKKNCGTRSGNNTKQTDRDSHAKPYQQFDPKINAHESIKPSSQLGALSARQVKLEAKTSEKEIIPIDALPTNGA